MRFSLVRWLQSSKWSIRTKLMGGFLIIAFFLIVLTGLAVGVIGELGQRLYDMAQVQQQVGAATQLLDSTNIYEESLQRLFFDGVALGQQSSQMNNTTGDPNSTAMMLNTVVTDYATQKARFTQARDKLTNARDTFTSLGVDISKIQPFLDFNQNQLPPLLTALDKLYEAAQSNQPDQIAQAWKNLQRQLPVSPDDQDIVRPIRNNNEGPANNPGLRIARLDGLVNLNALKSELTSSINRTQAQTAKTLEDTTNTKNFSQIALLIAGIIAVVLALGFGLLLTLVFTRPVERLRRRLMQLSSGDLATPLTVPNRDQFGELAVTFNQSINRLGGVVEQVQDQSLKVSSAAAQIATASSHSAVVSVEQAGAVAEATVTIEELSHTAQQIAEAATLVANAAEQALSSASDGQETVRESIVGINNLKNRVREITDRILALSERSQRVGHIIEQVASIADQTHLLALNAAIESAAAGENGKRFAVVAASVKQLAERSRQATKDVQAVLSEIQAATNASVMVTEQGLKEAERGVTLAHRTGDANENIIQMVERTVQLASAISLATQQQRSASEQVVSSMRQLATVIQDGASSAKQSSSLAAALDEVAMELRRLSSQFKVAANRTGHHPDDSASAPQFEEVIAPAHEVPASLPAPSLRPEVAGGMGN